MAFIIYILKAALILAAFFALFRFLELRRDTFHTLNRTLLLGMLALSFVLPLCRITIHKPILEPGKEPVRTWNMVPGQTATGAGVSSGVNAGADGLALSSGRQKQQTVAPVDILPDNRIETTNALNIRSVLLIALLAVWGGGFLLHLSRTVRSLIQIRYIISGGSLAGTRDGVRIVTVGEDIEPFSWNRTAVLSQGDYESDNADIIIEHECAHVRCRHSLDILAVDLLSSLQWFNPVTVWLRNDLQSVHEYQADRRVLTSGYNAGGYQFLLLQRQCAISRYSMASPLARNGLKNRIRMMNCRETDSRSRIKALYAPMLTLLILGALAVTVHDRTTGGFRGIRPDNTMFGDSIDALDATFGQGKFNLGSWEIATLWIQPDMDGVRMEWASDTITTTIGNLRQYLNGSGKAVSGKPVRQVTVCIEEMRLDGERTCALDTLRPMLQELSGMGVRPLVVSNGAQAAQTDLSTYKYARIAPLGDGTYRLSHNGLSTEGSLRDMAWWTNTLDIQYMAFYPDADMPWTHAQKLMNVALKRGVRTFFVCMREADGRYRMTVLPTRSKSTARFSGKTVAQVAEMLEDQVQHPFEGRAEKVIHYPQCSASLISSTVDRVAWCSDGLYVVLQDRADSRNVWMRPMEAGAVSVRVGDRLYPLVEHCGYQEFADYPLVPEFGYANGCFCWVPEPGVHYSVLKFEPVPANADLLDIEFRDYPGICLIKGLHGEEGQSFVPDSHTANQGTHDLFVPFSMPDNHGIMTDMEDIVSDPANRFVALYFWRSNDTHCIEEIPELKRIAGRFRSDGFSLTGISLDTDSVSWTRAIDEHGMDWLQLCDLEGKDGSIAQRYKVEFTPMFFVIDCSVNRICATGIGANRLETVLELLTE